ncbi:hypothetical protein GBAR_LOCUS20757 [Geodia barretti]|uniref:Uncharacterized protein n=1 Tax=Geodia barretti TaxID=519541 RepID=A0AA35SWS1_GEOBA|nr:hypothetical protein GBAR_LOCUS20757 [Geodia barretti]
MRLSLPPRITERSKDRPWGIHCAALGRSALCVYVLCRETHQERMATAQTISHWSRPHIRHTDHWSKLKSKSYYHSQTSTGNYICYCRPQNYG